MTEPTTLQAVMDRIAKLREAGRPIPVRRMQIPSMRTLRPSDPASRTGLDESDFVHLTELIMDAGITANCDVLTEIREIVAELMRIELDGRPFYDSSVSSSYDRLKTLGDAVTAAYEHAAPPLALTILRSMNIGEPRTVGTIRGATGLARGEVRSGLSWLEEQGFVSRSDETKPHDYYLQPAGDDFRFRSTRHAIYAGHTEISTA